MIGAFAGLGCRQFHSRAHLELRKASDLDRDRVLRSLCDRADAEARSKPSP